MFFCILLRFWKANFGLVNQDKLLILKAICNAKNDSDNGKLQPCL